MIAADHLPDHLPEIDGYSIVKPLYRGTKTAVYRAIREVDQLPVVIKVMRQVYPSCTELVQFRNQYTITKNLNIPHIIRPLNLESYHNGYLLVMEDLGSISLVEYIQQKSLDWVSVLEIARELTDVLHHLHQNQIIHKDIKPANILIHPETKQIHLIDFSIASLLPKETQEIQNPHILEGTLSYLAPEQTGRMNRGIDYRADFYSLGVTLYELLTGELPFRSEDPLELVHCHLAKKPRTLEEINPEIPPILSQIVLKLMAKNAEHRYQSARGIKEDLEECLQQGKNLSKIIEFPLGTRDICERFLIPENLYGREQEVKTLLQAFERVAHGTSEMMLVAGFSGIGKTAVVNEIHKPITRQKGYFIKGKFDQFNRNIPLSAFVQALRDLMGQLLTESEIELNQWKSKILAALGETGQVLIEVIPELERLIGEQPTVLELSGNAAQNRFYLLFQKFIEVFTTSDHPLVIFLDDLQWVDSASLQLIKILMEEKSYLLLLGAYRDNEVSPVHPFIFTIDELKKTGKTINTITLNPLSFPDINHFLADTLHCFLEAAHPLTELIQRKTQGNPFFITQFLKALHDENQIIFNHNKGYWEYNLQQINQLSPTDNVVEFMAQQLQKLPSDTQEVLKLAACVGNQFDLETLAIVSEKSDIEVAVVLWKTLQDGLILPQSDVYKFYLSADEKDRNKALLENVQYRFLHDRVQQAAYSLIPDQEKQITHYHIGQLLLDKVSPENREDRIFELVNHLNYGITLITQQNQRDELAELNLIACRKARNGTAYQAAYEYAMMGINLLGSEGWQSKYNITLQLHELAAEASAILVNFPVMSQLINGVIEQSKTILDQVGVYLIKIQALTIKSDFLEAISCGQSIIEKLGVNFPEPITPEQLEQEIEEIKILMGDHSIEELLYLPPMIDPEKLAIMKIANRMIPACYFANSPLFPLLASLQVKLSLQYGNSPISSTGYADYGIFLISFKKDIATSNQLGQLAYHLASTEPDKSIRAVTFVPVSLYLYHHQFHLRDTIPIFQAGYEAALEVGKLDFVGHNVQGFCMSSYWCGQLLVDLEPAIRAYQQILLKLNLITSEKYCSIFLDIILFLSGHGDNNQFSINHNSDEIKWLSESSNAQDITRLFHFYLHRAILRFLWGEISLAKSDIKQARIYQGGGSATVCEAGLYLYDSLITLATLSELPEQVEKQLQQVGENQENLELLAQYAPMNYQHKVDLVLAEKSRVLGQKLEAIERYDQAILGAKENGYIHEEALANELAAKFYLDWGKDKIAAVYMQESYYAYARWGAQAKVTDLELHYPQLLTGILLPHYPAISSGVTISQTLIKEAKNISNNQNLWLDFPALMKAAQAISQEITLEKLLATLMKIVIRNAGAERGYLILHQDEKWSIVVKGETEEINTLNVPMTQSLEIPQSLIRQVIHTQETVVFDNLSSQSTSDPYIINHQPQSVLCTPISYQGKLVGILYLENNLTVGAFTKDRVEILQFLTSQAAISLENAYLYRQTENYSEILEAEVERQTQALHQKAQDLEQTLQKLRQTQSQLIQTEKMSSLGQLVAGIAHEINNPVNFIKGNIGPTQNYIKDLIRLLKLYEQEYPQPSLAIQTMREEIEVDFLFEDVQKILESMDIGSNRISQIVQSLRNFSRLDESAIKRVDIHSGIDSTLLILQHRFKGTNKHPEIKIIKEYSQRPLIQCYPSALNQVFMNILSNAIDALQQLPSDGSPCTQTPTITIRTWIKDEKNLVISIADNGLGIPETIRERIFDPFFTTKEVGKGTGLGLSISYQIIVEKHQGQLFCQSLPDSGVEFIIEIPL